MSYLEDSVVVNRFSGNASVTCGCQKYYNLHDFVIITFDRDF